METEIYVDVLFFINFAMDYVVFYTSDKILNTNICWKRMFIGSITAALLYCIICIKPIYNIRLISQICISATAVWIAFNPKDIHNFLRQIITVNLTALFLGGVSLVLFFYTDFNFLGKNFSLHINSFPLSMLIIGAAGGVLIIMTVKKLYNNKLMTAQKFCSVDIYMNNKHTIIKALIDTGNSLKEPVTQKPVIIAEYEIIKPLADIYDFENNFNYQIKILPYESIGNKKGVLMGFVADKASIDKNTIYNPIIAVCRQKLSVNNKFNGLINPEIINGGYNV